MSASVPGPETPAPPSAVPCASRTRSMAASSLCSRQRRRSRSAASPSSTSSAVHARVGASALGAVELDHELDPAADGHLRRGDVGAVGQLLVELLHCFLRRRETARGAFASRRWDGRAGGQERRREGADEEGGGGWSGEEGEGRGALRVHLILGGGKSSIPNITMSLPSAAARSTRSRTRHAAACPRRA